ncbi:MAG: zinc-binding dehydrogenase [Chloroflexi bacterium]|nr:zinc-binding dehydrogenase [Chloroflexota bacterium]
MNTMRAVVVDQGAPGHLALAEVPLPTPGSSEALVRVAAISLNRGETRRAQTGEPGTRPGWDLAGTVETAAADGSGPRPGQRVVGLVRSGAWAEVVAVPTSSLAVLPEGVSFAQAATLPVAGLTALVAMEKRGGLLGSNVLITGASGGVGLFAIQIASLMGARVVGLVRQERHAGAVRDAGAHEVVASDDGSAAATLGPYDFVLESVGGGVLINAMSMLAVGGTCISIGHSGGDPQVSLNPQRTFGGRRVTLSALTVFNELPGDDAARALGRLARLVADGRLRPLIAVEAPWSEVGTVAQRLLDRSYPGKGVLLVS